MSRDVPRVAVKLFAPEPGLPDSTFVSVFHDWIRSGQADAVLLDVADYSHVPNGQGIMLIAHAVAYSLDRTDGRFGLRAQQRHAASDDAEQSIASVVRHTLDAAGRLERDPRAAGHLAFARDLIRVEANDRLRAPNTPAGFRALAPVVTAACRRALPDRAIDVRYVERPPRERLAIDVVVRE